MRAESADRRSIFRSNGYDFAVKAMPRPGGSSDRRVVKTAGEIGAAGRNIEPDTGS